jgi:hypothetical protein
MPPSATTKEGQFKAAVAAINTKILKVFIV